MSETVSGDDSMNSEDGMSMSPDSSSLFLGEPEPEPGQGSSAPSRNVLEFDVITETDDDDTTERPAAEDDEVGVCSTSVAANSSDDPEPEPELEDSAPIPIHTSDASDAETKKCKAAEDDESGLCSPPASAMLPDELGIELGGVVSSSIPFCSRDFDVLGYDGDSDDDVPLYLLRAGKAVKVPLVGHKEPISALAVQFQSAIPILQEKIKLIDEQYSALRRTRGDGNCFYRSFMFSYLEHILETQDDDEVERINENIEQCKKTLQRFGYDDLTYEDFFIDFTELLDNVLQGHDSSISHEMLLKRSCDALYSNNAVMFLRFVTSGEIHRRKDFFAPFIVGLENTTVDEFCKESVEPMGVECDQVHVIALSDALGVPIRVVYLDQSTNDMGAIALNHHDFIPGQHDTTENTSVASDSPKPDDTTENTTSVASAVPKPSQDGTTENTTSDASVASDGSKLFETSGQDGTTENTTSVTSDPLTLFETSGQDGTTENTTSVVSDAPKPFVTSGQNGTTKNTKTVASDAQGHLQQIPFVTLLYRPGHYDILYSK